MNIPSTARAAPRFRPPLAVGVVVIDLDGTLIHTAPDLAASANAMLADLGLPQRSQAEVEQWIGNGVARLVKRALTGRRDGEPDPALFERGYGAFLEHYGRLLTRASRPYPGVRAGLARLAEEGYRLACITNKAERFTRPLLEALDLARHFELVLSGDSLPKKKPDPLPLLHACRHFGIAPAAGLLVGDSANDTQAAQAAGMPVICVTYGYHQGRDLAALGAVALIDSLEELPQYIRPLPRSRPRPSPEHRS